MDVLLTRLRKRCLDRLVMQDLALKLKAHARSCKVFLSHHQQMLKPRPGQIQTLAQPEGFTPNLPELLL
jgi:hypothetical protein